jgi:glycosyltransferase involved in cell wall biosynthesis
MHRYERHFQEYQGRVYHERERHYRTVCADAVGILVDSELGRRHVVESYDRDPETVFVLPFAPPTYLLNTADVNVKEKYGLPDRYLFYPAQFWEHKNHIRLIEAVARTKEGALPVKLVLAGSPKNAYRRVVSRIEELGLEGDVFILGYVPNEDLSALYRHAVATVFVSLLGPTNIPPLEAMAVGSPLIVSNVYAMPEQVGDAALLVDPMDVEDIANKIALLWGGVSLRERLIERGHARSAAWTEEQFSARLTAIIERVVGLL